jgi:hypothetical protein
LFKGIQITFRKPGKRFANELFQLIMRQERLVSANGNRETARNPNA